MTMNTHSPLHRCATTLAFGACLSLEAMAQAPSLPRHDAGASQTVAAAAAAVAAWPEKTFLESIAVSHDGTIWIANKEGARIERVAPDGTRHAFATLPEGITGIELAADGGLFATGRVKGGPETVYRIDAQGRAEVLLEVPEAKFLNGLARISPQTLLVADSGAKTVWRIDVATRSASRWLVHDWLGPRDPAHEFPKNTFIPGANGVKRFRDAVFVSSTDRGLVVRIPIRPDGGAGEPAIWARDLVIDDFAFDTDGNLYGSTHPLSTVVRVRADGSRATIATGSDGVVGATAVAFGTRPGDERSLYVVGNGRIAYRQQHHPVQVVKLDVGVPGYPRHQAVRDGATVRQVARLETFLVTAATLPGSDTQRRDAALAYTTYLETNLDRIALGVQVFDAPGVSVTQRLYFVRAPDADAARAVIDGSPYAKAEVYRVSDVKPATGMLGELMGGVVWAPRTKP
jgi:sugar lactone lactonase YvrE